jgi:endoglucanase
VNVSAFVDTDTITKWAADLAAALGDDKGVLVDTSRNGQGTPPENIKGDARWCNPQGRGLGPVATTETGKDRIDAYVYIKTVGESDGDCFGNPPAGEFVPELALELARNARQ